MEVEQVYIVGKVFLKDSFRKDGNVIQYDFMLQCEVIDLKILINILNGFFQLQFDKGYFFKKIVGFFNFDVKFKVIIWVCLSDMGYDNCMMLISYFSDYFMLDE